LTSGRKTAPPDARAGRREHADPVAHRIASLYLVRLPPAQRVEEVHLPVLRAEPPAVHDDEGVVDPAPLRRFEGPGDHRGIGPGDRGGERVDERSVQRLGAQGDGRSGARAGWGKGLAGGFGEDDQIDPGQRLCPGGGRRRGPVGVEVGRGCHLADGCPHAVRLPGWVPGDVVTGR